MAIKQRLLVKLYSVDKTMVTAFEKSDSQMTKTVFQELKSAQDLCKHGLSHSSYIAYEEIYDTLLLVFREMISNGMDSLPQEAFSLCKELIKHVIDQTKKELNFKKEIVFLPYNAAMWDSMESLWKAANDDKEHCIAYVIPIPYADRNSDGSVLKWHCEKSMFPAYVPTLDWNRIDLKSWHPDVIIFHNPYDEYNLVTSVDSRYYSRNLKQCADLLIYVPYFVFREPYTENSILNQVMTQGSLNADIVLVQSEELKRLYINILTKNTKHKDRIYWEKRIIGFGSPKFDKVINSKREDFELPEKWTKLVKGKKVVLYNTSLGAMLQYTDKVCAKLRQVLDTFRKRKDIVLWWRPHPLMKSTFHSMRPDFEDEYCKIEEEYIRGGWGIYDTSSDLHRAIAWSDAYYGDGSSVLTLYKATGKPVLMQSFLTEHDIHSLWFITGIIKDNYFYFPAFNKNGLFRIDVSSNCSFPERVAFFPDGNNDCALYCKMFEYDNMFFFIPTYGQGIVSYKIDTGEWQTYSLDGLGEEDKPWFSDAYLCGDMIWLKPYCAHEILSFNLNNHEIKTYTDWFDDIKSNIKDKGMLWGGGIFVNDKMIFPFLHGNVIISFDTKNKESVVYNIGHVEDVCDCMLYDGDNCWIYLKNGDLLQCDMDFHEIKRLKNIFGHHCSSVAMCYGNNKIWVFAVGSDDYVIVDGDNEDVDINHSFLKGANKMLAPYPVVKGNYIYIYPNNCEDIVKINMLTKEIERIEVRESEKDYREYCEHYIEILKKDSDIVYKEWSFSTLEILLKMVCDSADNSNSVSSSSNIGKMIYDYLSKL